MRAAMTQSVRDRSACPPAGVSPDALASLILVVGAPRSGTTWLAKIIDSHPDVLYRHEPDETLPGSASLTGATLQGLLADWVADRGARSASKRPFFPKSWQPAWALALRTLFAGAVSAAARLPPPLNRLARVDIPDLMRRPAPRVAIKSVRWAEGAAILARTLPASRTIFILRHPCGQVASVMRGNRQTRFDLKTEGTDMPFDEAATRPFAAAHGISDRSFPALPEAAKYAWSWRAFNEPAYAALAAAATSVLRSSALASARVDKITAFLRREEAREDERLFLPSPRFTDPIAKRKRYRFLSVPRAAAAPWPNSTERSIGLRPSQFAT